MKIFNKKYVDITVRFISEFWIPFLVSVFVTGYSWRQSTSSFDLLGKFVMNFFAIGWVFNQFNRIAKQKRTEDGLNNIEKRVGELISNLDVSTSRMISYSTGGDSFCEFVPTPTTLIFRNQFGLIHHGDFPLYDVKVRIVDIERLKLIGNKARDENKFEFDVLIPNHMTTFGIASPIKTSNKFPCHYNIFVTARNGSTVQMFQAILVNGLLRTASTIERGDEVIFEEAAVDYPRGPDGLVDWNANQTGTKSDIESEISQ